MSRARVRALAIILALLIGAAIAVAVLGREHRRLQPRAPGERPTLLLLTSLPLVFGEQFSLQGGGSPALAALETRYRVVPISVTGPADLAKGRLLLMAHPAAQPAEDLVALDDWVRRGGHLLLLADPMLDWPSSRPLGDPLRPPPMFMDTGLLAHWGLRLDAPDERGPALRRLGGYDVEAVSPGRLVGDCEIAADAAVARCRIGKGRAIIVADADFLDTARLGKAGEHNLDGLLAELDSLERP
jgi:hypothetical protein